MPCIFSGTAQQAGPFGAKPGGFGTTTSTLGGTTTGFGTGVGTGLGAGTSLFNNQQKPALGGGLGSMGFGVGTTGKMSYLLLLAKIVMILRIVLFINML